uniref:Uncharacterized protein n=1 Tax=Panagrellus redivivus TaxID=6233 RepID=A0A7E4W5K3_PANRE
MQRPYNEIKFGLLDASMPLANTEPYKDNDVVVPDRAVVCMIAANSSNVSTETTPMELRSAPRKGVQEKPLGRAQTRAAAERHCGSSQNEDSDMKEGSESRL